MMKAQSVSQNIIPPLPGAPDQSHLGVRCLRCLRPLQSGVCCRRGRAGLPAPKGFAEPAQLPFFSGVVASSTAYATAHFALCPAAVEVARACPERLQRKGLTTAQAPFHA